MKIQARYQFAYHQSYDLDSKYAYNVSKPKAKFWFPQTAWNQIQESVSAILVIVDNKVCIFQTGIYIGGIS